MFCPQCGNQLPDGSAFCGKCGTKLNAPSQPAGGVSPAPGTTGARPASARVLAMPAVLPTAAVSATSPLRVLLAVVAAIALIFSVMPWFNTASSVQSASSLAAQGAEFLGSMTGQSYDLPELQESYAPWQFNQLASDFKAYRDALDSLNSAVSNLAGALSGQAQVVEIAEPQMAALDGGILGLSLIFLLWVVGFLALLVGAIATLARGRGKLIVVVGGIALVVAGLVWAAIAGGMGDIAGPASASPAICTIAAAAVVVLALTQPKACA